MKTIKIMSAMLTAAAVAFSMGLTSCGNDDDEPDYPPTPLVESYTVKYEVKLGQAYYDFYDLTIEYTDANGQDVTMPLTKDFALSFNVPAKNVADDYELEVKGAVKANLPAIDPAAKYTFSKAGYMIVTGNRSDNTSWDAFSSTITHSSLTLAGNKMNDYLAKHKNIELCDYKWELNK